MSFKKVFAGKPTDYTPFSPRAHGVAKHILPSRQLASTYLFLASALAMAFFTPCSAILTQSYGNSIGQFWHIFT
jgi:hypothetical protein